MDDATEHLRERLLEQVRNHRAGDAADQEKTLVTYGRDVLSQFAAAGDEREALAAQLLSEVAAVPPEEWRDVCVGRRDPGQYAVLLRGLDADGGEFWDWDRNFIALAVVAHAGVLPPVAEEMLKRVEHVGPQQVADGLSLDEAIAVKLDLEHWGGWVKLKEGAVRKPAGRESIPERVRHEVWRRDGGRCKKCESRERLEFDHIIPVSEGGSNTARNLQLLCEKCNREKAARI